MRRPVNRDVVLPVTETPWRREAETVPRRRPSLAGAVGVVGGPIVSGVLSVLSTSPPFGPSSQLQMR